MVEIKINTPYIKLGQFLKFAHLINLGSQEKIFLLTKTIFVNNEQENRRGRKLYPNDSIKIEDKEYKIINA